MRAFTRLREKPQIKLFGGTIEPARLARAHAIVAQARSFVQSSAVTIEVEPADNSAKEEELTAKLERWLHGVQYALNGHVTSPYREALWHYFESGQWIVRTLFDIDLALAGEFPFCIEAVDPRTFMFKKSAKGLMCAAIEERKKVDVVIHELEAYYNQASTPTWEIPNNLKDKRSNETVTVTRYYDDEEEYLFVDQTPVWCKPHLMGRVPFDIAFCNDIPSTSDRPEEQGLGLIYPVLDNLRNESELSTKMITPIELYFYPSMGVRTSTHYEIRQAYPGQRWEVGNESPSPTTITPTPNYQVIDNLQSRMEQDIARATFPEAVFGPMDIQLSGYAYTQAMSGLQERLKDYAREPERALSRHFSMLLRGVAKFNNLDVVTELNAAGQDTSKYVKSFSVVMAAPLKGYKRTRTRIELKDSEIEGHEMVHVTLQPNMDRDESAKYQRAAMAKTQLFLPDDYIYRKILNIENVDEVLRSKQTEELKASNPEFAEFLADDQLNQILTRDKELGKRFEMWRAAKQLIEAQIMQEQTDPTAGVVEEPTDAPPGILPPTDPALIAEQQMMGQQGAPVMPMAPTGAMVPPGSGMMGMPPMQGMGNTPVSPEELAIQQMMQGEGVI